MGHLYEFHDSRELGTFNYLQLKIQQLIEVNRMMAHNLRGAAANIRMLVDELEATDKAGDKAEDGLLTKEELFSYLRQTSDNMNATLERLMEMNRKDTEAEVHPVRCNISEIVGDIRIQLSRLLLEKKASIILDLENAEVMYSRPYLENILYNLISNAIKYSEPGRPLQIKISTSRKNGRQVLEVSDNGLGMDMDKCSERLFCPYYSTDATGVHGLGLYLVKSQVESLGGRISVNSTPHAGTKFTVQL